MSLNDELNVFFLVFREPQGIIACCNPVPPLVRQQINEMHLLIQQAREMPLLKVRSFAAKGSRSTGLFSLLAPVVFSIHDLVSILKNPEKIIGVRKGSRRVVFFFNL